MYRTDWFDLLSKKQEVILSRAKDYYKNHKERLKKQARDKCRNLREYAKIIYHNISKK